MTLIISPPSKRGAGYSILHPQTGQTLLSLGTEEEAQAAVQVCSDPEARFWPTLKALLGKGDFVAFVPRKALLEERWRAPDQRVGSPVYWSKDPAEWVNSHRQTEIAVEARIQTPGRTKPIVLKLAKDALGQRQRETVTEPAASLPWTLALTPFRAALQLALVTSDRDPSATWANTLRRVRLELSEDVLRVRATDLHSIMEAKLPVNGPPAPERVFSLARGDAERWLRTLVKVKNEKPLGFDLTAERTVLRVASGAILDAPALSEPERTSAYPSHEPAWENARSDDPSFWSVPAAEFAKRLKLTLKQPGVHSRLLCLAFGGEEAKLSLWRPKMAWTQEGGADSWELSLPNLLDRGPANSVRLAFNPSRLGALTTALLASKPERLIFQIAASDKLVLLDVDPSPVTSWRVGLMPCRFEDASA